MLGEYFPDQASPQTPADVAVVMTTVVRPKLLRAVQSVFQQQFSGRIQILIGVDVAKGPLEGLLQLIETRPAHVSFCLLTLP